MLVDEGNVFRSRPQLQTQNPYIAQTMRQLSDNDWKRVQQILSKIFSKNKLKIETSLDCCFSRLETHLNDISKDDRPIEIDAISVFRKYVLDLLYVCMFSSELKKIYCEDNNECFSIVNNLLNPPLSRKAMFNLIPTVVRRHMKVLPQEKELEAFAAFATKIIKSRRSSGKGNKKDLVQLLVNSCQCGSNTDSLQLRDEQIIGLCLSVLIEGEKRKSCQLTANEMSPLKLTLIRLIVLGIHIKMSSQKFSTSNRYIKTELLG